MKGDGKTAQQAKVLAAEPDTFSAIPGTYVAEGQNQGPKRLLSGCSSGGPVFNSQHPHGGS